MRRLFYSITALLLLSLSLGAQSFRTVKIGNQTWMAENLNKVVPDSWYYNENSELGSVYGRLYTWEAAKKACPAGWHLPTEREWQSLIDNSGGEDLAARQLRAGGASGFNALLGGMSDVGNFRLLKSYGTFWTASEYDTDHAWYVYITGNSTNVTKTFFKKVYAFSVRCVKD